MNYIFLGPYYDIGGKPVESPTEPITIVWAEVYDCHTEAGTLSMISYPSG